MKPTELRGREREILTCERKLHNNRDPHTHGEGTMQPQSRISPHTPYADPRYVDRVPPFARPRDARTLDMFMVRQ